MWHNRRFTACYIGMTVLALVAQLMIFRSTILNYSPLGDIFPLIVHSTNYVNYVNPVEWFLQGYSQYFNPYPAWSEPATNFLRPLYNALLFVMYEIAGSNWNVYLLINYAFVSISIGLTAKLSVDYFGLRLRDSLLAGAMLFVISFRLAVHYKPEFIMDAISATFVAAAFLMCISSRLYLAVTFLVLGVLSKETLIWTPLAAFLTYVTAGSAGKQHDRRVVTRKAIRGLVLFFPLAVWVTLRLGAFGSLFSGVYMLNANEGLGRFLATLAKGMLRWPLGVESSPAYLDEVRSLLAAERWTDIATLLLIGLNTLIAFACAYLLIRRWYTIYSTATIRIAALWVLPLLGAMTLFNMHPRFGYLYFMLSTPFMLWSYRSARSIFVRITAGVWLVSVAVASVPSMVQAHQTFGLRLFEYQQSRRLLRLVMDAYACDPSGTVYLVNDITGRYGASSIGALATRDHSLDFVVVNSLIPDHVPSVRDVSVATTSAGTEVLVAIACPTAFVFPNASGNVMFRTAQLDSTGGFSILGNRDMRYSFPGGSFSRRVLTGNMVPIFGDTMRVLIPDASGHIVYLDRNGEYVAKRVKR